MAQLYRVNTAHTSTSVFDTSKFDVIAKPDAVTGKATNWRANTEYKQYDIIYHQDRLLTSISNHTSASTFDADKDNWKFLTSHINEWTEDYNYTLQDVVLYDGTLYECIEAHKSSAEFDDLKWSAIGGGSGGSINYWTENTMYEVDDIVATNFGSVFRLWRCIVAHLSTTTFDETKFQGLTVDIIVKPWNSGSNYKSGQLVTIDGILFIHNGTHQCTDVNCSYLIPASSHIFNYSNTRNYNIGDIVRVPAATQSEEDGFYICLEAHTPETTFDETKWKKIGGEVDLTKYAKLASPVFTGNPQAPTQNINDKTTKIASTAFVHNLVDARTPTEWATGVQYIEKQLVLYNKALYMCKQNHTSSSFLADKNNWDVVSANIQPWSENTAFREGIIVIFNKRLYVCKQEHTSSTSFSPDASKWILIGGEGGSISIATEDTVGGVVSTTLEGGIKVNPDGTMVYNAPSSSVSGIVADTAWQSETEYKENNVVGYDGTVYICTADHTSTTTFDTDFASGYWSKISTPKVGASGYVQALALGVTGASSSNPYIKSLAINETKDFILPPIEVLEEADAPSEILNNIHFENSEADDFTFDSDVVSFDGKMHLKTSFEVPMTSETVTVDIPAITNLFHFDGTREDASGKEWSYSVEDEDVTYESSGKFGQALSLGTDDYIYTPDEESFAFGEDDFTIDFWVYIPSGSTSVTVTTPNVNDVPVIGVSINSPTSCSVYCSDPTSEITFTIDATGNFTDKWTHIAVVRNNLSLKLYIDGTLVGQNPCAFDLISGSIGFCYSFAGKIDELSVARKAKWTSNFIPPIAPYTLTDFGTVPVFDGYLGESEGIDFSKINQIKEVSV